MIRISDECMLYEVPVLIFEVLNSGRLSTQMLTKVKGTLPLDRQSNVVYHIPCSCGQVYIGEIKWILETRLKVYWDACKKEMMEKSAVVEYACVK